MYSYDIRQYAIDNLDPATTISVPFVLIWVDGPSVWIRPGFGPGRTGWNFQ